MNTTPKILVVSSANMDFVMHMKEVPAAGQTVIEHQTYEYVPGGKGANSSVAFRRLGAETVFCSRLGKDANGDTLLSLYRSEGIDVSFLSHDPDTATGLAAILVEESGQNRIVVYPGANLTIEESQIRAAVASKPDALFMQLEIAPEAILFAASEAAKAGIPVFIDAGPAKTDFPFGRLPTLEVFSPNETETKAFTGISPDDDASCLAASQKLAEMVAAKHYVLKLGGRGAYVYSPAENSSAGIRIPTYDLVKVVDTTAAGDAFTAGLTLEYLRSGDILRAVRYGNVVGTITISRPGASPSIPSTSEIDAFIARHGIVL